MELYNVTCNNDGSFTEPAIWPVCLPSNVFRNYKDVKADLLDVGTDVNYFINVKAQLGLYK